MAPLPFIGGHVSASGGFHRAIENAERIGADAIQFFGASPRQWFAKLPERSAIEKYKNALRGSRVKAVYLHAAYLPNLAATSKISLQKSIKNLVVHLHIAHLIEARSLIFHMGSCNSGLSREDALKQTAHAMKEILKIVPGETQLIMENSAGGGQKLCNTPEELGIIKSIAASSRIKICLDTAHAFEAGILGPDFTHEHIKHTLDNFAKHIDLKDIVAIHVNDSKTPFNSHSDRHENLGRGHMGLNAFRALAREKCQLAADWILEVPGYDNEGPDRENVDILRSCFYDF